MRGDQADQREVWVGHPGPEAPLGKDLATVDGVAAVALVEGLSRLPGGDRMRCFFPHYAMRVRGHDGEVTDVALCFE